MTLRNVSVSAIVVIVTAFSGAASAASPEPAKAAPRSAPLTEIRRSITLAGARVAVDAVVAEATRRHVGAAVAVVDDGGHVVAVERVDGTFAEGARISQGKARTAVVFKKPTGFFEKLIRDGRTPMVALEDGFTPLQGGIPIEIGGIVVGAVGVSGASSAAEDEELAQIGVSALTGGPRVAPAQPAGVPVTFFGHDRVRDAFARGVPLLEAAGYKVHASRREGPGSVEIHERDTDIIYVLSGSAVLVTGGKIVDGKLAAPDEIRGASIEGGEARQLSPGDVLVVPKGVPHWFREVRGPLTYYVVKVG
jgi:glc operon protein GlcG